MKMSEIKTDDLKKYLRADGNEDDVFINAVIDAAKQYVRTYTAQEDKFLEQLLYQSEQNQLPRCLSP